MHPKVKIDGNGWVPTSKQTLMTKNVELHSVYQKCIVANRYIRSDVYYIMCIV